MEDDSATLVLLDIVVTGAQLQQSGLNESWNYIVIYLYSSFFTIVSKKLKGTGDPKMPIILGGEVLCILRGCAFGIW